MLPEDATADEIRLLTDENILHAEKMAIAKAIFIGLNPTDRKPIVDMFLSLYAERTVLKRRVWALETMREQDAERRKFGLNESPWQTYERLRKIVVKRGYE